MKILAFDLSETIDFKLISSSYGISQVTKWEEPLILQYLEKNIHIYQFGAAVFFGHTEKEAFNFFSEMETKTLKKINYGNIEIINYIMADAPPAAAEDWNNEEYIFDQYEETIYFNNKLFNQKFLKIISFVIAQSAALERYDKLTENLETEIERTMAWFNRYKYLLPLLANKSMDKSLQILRMRHTIVSDLMILDKPLIAWENIGCNELYDMLGRFFELNRRYKNISLKLDYSLETSKTLSDLFGHIRANFLELLIVIMILWEIIWELLKSKVF